MFYEVVLDSGETPNKCTIASLFYRPDFQLLRVKGGGVFGPLKSSILLHHEGPCLTTLQKSLNERNRGVACIDCVWRRLDRLLRRIAHPLPLLAKIPEGFETAYPRSSKQNTDPRNGLATIEAIFIASAILGNWDISLLSEYYFGRKFLELNKNRFLELGVHQAHEGDNLPILPKKPKHSFQRRLDRGRF